MYQYNDFDKQLLQERVAQFRGQVDRRLKGELSEEEFQPLRLMNGLYLQLHAYMLRVAVPYGLFSSKQMRQLAHIARKYDRDYGHFTTRQNIQYNWLKLVDVPDVLADLAAVDMHAIQTSGNCIRNISCDPLAGVAGDEFYDPRPLAEIMRQYSTFHPEFSYLPRKFKMAFSGAKADRAAVKFHDIGYYVKQNDKGETGLQILAGGGMGRTPMVGKVVRAWIEIEHMLSYTEAIMRVYNRHGRRDNKYKARIKILVHELGIEEFTRQVEAEWAQIKDSGLKLLDSEVEQIASHFNPPAYEKLPATSAAVEDLCADNKKFADWYRYNVTPHKVSGYCAVTLSLKTKGVPPGDITADQMDVVANLADQYSFGEIRSTYQQNLVLAQVRLKDLPDLWDTLRKQSLASANIERLTDIICCPGLDYCNLANARSIPIAEQIVEHFDNMDYVYDLGDVRLNMSGCINACGHHHAGNIGILGVDKKGEEFYQITLGGSPNEDASIGAIIGPAFPPEQVIPALENIFKVYLDNREGETERFLDVVRRIGIAPFKERVYADH